MFSKSIKIILILSVFIIFLAGCSNKTEIEKVEIERYFGLDKAYGNNATRCTGSYKNLIYVLDRKNRDYIVKFYDLKGNIDRKIKLNYGKGPGEVIFNWIVKVVDNKIYFHDIALKKITVYDLNGEFIDDIMLKNYNEHITDFTAIGDYIYLHGVYDKRFIKIDYSGNKIDVSKYNNKLNPDQKNKRVKRDGAITFSVGYIYKGLINKPFRINKYDKSMNKVLTITHQFDESFEDCMWTERGRLIGDFFIHELAVDKNYIYVPFGKSIHYEKNGLKESKIDNRLLIFDKKNGELKKIIWNKKLKNSASGYNILGVNKDNIIIAKLFHRECLDEMVENPEDKWGWIILLDNPMYE